MVPHVLRMLSCCFAVSCQLSRVHTQHQASSLHCSPNGKQLRPIDNFGASCRAYAARRKRPRVAVLTSGEWPAVASECASMPGRAGRNAPLSASASAPRPSSRMAALPARRRQLTGFAQASNITWWQHGCFAVAQDLMPEEVDSNMRMCSEHMCAQPPVYAPLSSGTACAYAPWLACAQQSHANSAWVASPKMTSVCAPPGMP